MKIHSSCPAPGLENWPQEDSMRKQGGPNEFNWTMLCWGWIWPFHNPFQNKYEQIQSKKTKLQLKHQAQSMASRLGWLNSRENLLGETAREIRGSGSSLSISTSNLLTKRCSSEKLLVGLVWYMQCLIWLCALLGCELWKPLCGGCEAELGRGTPLHRSWKLLCVLIGKKEEAELSCRSLNHHQGN